MDGAIDYRSKCKHFRTLIIGRANAGKTTLLKKVCNSIDDPEIFSPSGKGFDPAVVQESSERGIHDIENELIFRSNPQFIFHDSRGFESGSLDEIEAVKSFIAKRAQSQELSEQLHAIWYCLPTDTNRPLLEADRSFFDKYCSGKVPVIAIFTKFDGLVTTTYGELRDKEKLSMKEAKNKKFERAQEELKTNFVDPIEATASRPSDYVRLDDMRMEDSSCDELIEKTANVLSDDRLKLLFGSVQQNNIDICIQYAIRCGMATPGGTDRLQSLIGASLAWFPHFWTNFEYDSGGRILLDTIQSCTSALRDKFSSPDELDASLQTVSGQADLLALICVCAEQTFTEASATKMGFVQAFLTALDAYVVSTVRGEVNLAIEVLLEGRDRLDNSLQKGLGDIIKNNRLRINVDTA